MSLSSSSLNLEPTGNSTSSSCSKMVHLSSGESGAALVSSSHPSSISNGNVHCSIGQQSGNGGGLAPIMEIREMNAYCNSCVTVGADKYWNHHHPHVSVSRHTGVYPQMFYTPPPPPLSAPPPPSVNYSTSSVAPAPPSNEWICPTATAESYSHFIYSQYPPPPPPPSQHHDYNNFLNMSTSCYESDLIMMNAVPGSSSQQNSCDPSVPVPTQAIMNSFMYPSTLPPPQLSSFENVISSSQSSVSTAQQMQATTKLAKGERFPAPATPPSPTSAASSTSDDSTDESDDDDDESSHIISIEDDENEKSIPDITSSPAPDVPKSLSLCVICKKAVSLLPTNAPSPQLSRILDNIDDDELDISVCSGDIEIGGIEDEMIQQATEQQQQKISLQKLTQLVGVSFMELTSGEGGGNGEQCNNIEQDALLCSKCQKLVGMAESLEKQFTSVLCTLRQVLSLEDSFTVPNEIKVLSSSQVNSIGVQTEDYDLDRQDDHILVRPTNIKTSSLPLRPHQEISSHPDISDKRQIVEAASDDNIKTLGQYLCHECGRHFNCKRNLGKHLKRHHHTLDSPLVRHSCPRGNCGKTFLDKTALQVHTRKHTSEKPYFCVTCFKLFTVKSNLTAHVKSGVCRQKTESTLSSASDQFSTIATSPTITSSNGKSVDDNTVNNIPFHCDNCGLTFRVRSRFQKHLSNSKSCNKSKLFQCDICSKPFAKRSELQAHKVVHSGQKSFICDICGMTFSTRGNQRVHQRTHFNYKRFKCQQCNKGFTRNQTLQIHIVNVHK